MRIAVFASGRGTNFSAIARGIKNGGIKANLALLVCDNPGASVLDKAKRAKIKIALIKREDFNSKSEFESRIIQYLEDNKIGLIVLAGFMRMLSIAFVQRYKNKILNIHPSLLPAFKGSKAIADAFNYGAKLTGVTVHFVDELMDHGPIILQRAVAIDGADTLESLENKIHKVEHKLYPLAVKLFVSKRLKIEDRRVKIA